MVSIHNYGVRHRYGTPSRNDGSAPGRGAELPDGPDHWSSDEPDDGDRPVREPGGADKGGGRKKIFPGSRGGRKLE